MSGTGDPAELAPDDAQILALESETITGHTLKLVILEAGTEPVDIEDLRGRVAVRLERQPRARQRVDTSTGGPRWVDAPDFDISHHVRRNPLGDGAGRADLWQAIGTLMSEHLDRDKPLWTLDVLGPLDDGSEAIAARIHHAMADGIACVGFLDDLVWDPHPETTVTADTPGMKAQPKTRLLKELERMPAAVRRELGHRGGPSPLDRPISGARELAFSVCDLAEMKAIGASLTDRATVNDVLLAIIAGGLRSWLGSSPHLRAQIPVSLHHRDEQGDAGNRDSFINVDLPLDEDDPIRRLESIRAQTSLRKQRDDAQELYDLLHALGRMPRIGAAVERLAGSSREFGVAVSNVPGPSAPVAVGGRRVENLFSSSEPAVHHALRISAISCNGKVGIGLCADPQALPGMSTLAEAIDASLTELRDATLRD